MATDLAAFAGEYYSEEVDATYRIAVSGDRLMLSGRHVPTEPLVPVTADTFRAGQMTLHFDRSVGGGAPSSFTVEAGRVRNIRFKRK
jgi:hypothetical protein